MGPYFRKSRLRGAVPAYAAGNEPPAGAAMTTAEFNALIRELITGLPVTLVVGRLCNTIFALVEMGGPPAAAALRAIVTLRNGDNVPDVDARDQVAERADEEP